MGKPATKRISPSIEERLRFESFMARLSLGLINLPLQRMQAEIRKALMETAKLFGSSWAVLTTGGSDKKSFQVMRADCTGEPSAGECIASLVLSPWYRKAKVRKKKATLTRLPDELPSTMTALKEVCRNAGVASIIGLPLQDDPVMPSFIAFGAARQLTIDALESGSRLARIGQLFTSALIRQKAALQFDELFRFERLLSEISSTFSGVSAEEVDRTIEFGLERISAFLGADYCNLVPFSRAERSRNIVYSWVRQGSPPLPKFNVPLGDLFPWFAERFKHRQVVYFSHADELPDEASADREEFNRIGTKSHVSVPIAVGRTTVGVLSIGTIRVHRSWSEELVQRLRLIGEIFANAFVRKQKQLEIQTAFSQIEKLNMQLEAECTYLRQEIELSSDFHNMIGQSEALKKVIHRIGQIAATDVTVLIHGETGTGKELVARAIHAASTRKDRPMVKVNCASLPANLIESELFGHEKGAFTGAQNRQIGRFELAHGSSLFLDEIGELPMASQAKLLRVLQEGEFERLGSAKTIKVDVRIIAATNRDLENEVQKGRFRQDLWYRLNVFPIEVPPLRQRSEDIPLLANWFILKSSKKLGKTIERVPAKAMKALQHFNWPGNVRELENVIERAVINSPHTSLQLLDKLDRTEDRSPKFEVRPTLEELERTYIVQTLEETKGRVEGPMGAAIILNLHPSTLRARMRKLGIQISAFVE